MLQIETYLHASDLAEAYRTLTSVPGSVVLGGCGYLRLGTRSITTAIDLSRLDLDYVTETANAVEIGAMTSLRTLETHPLCAGPWNGVLARAVENIVGVQLRNCVTIGGTVAGRYPFSDPIAALLALGAQLKLYRLGQVTLEEFLAGDGAKDILEKIIIPKNGQVTAFTSIRRTKTDYAVLNAASARTGNNFRIVVGSRPGRAMLAVEAADYLTTNGLNDDSIREAGRIAAETLQFGDNPRGSAAYRKLVCPVLIGRALTEVLHAA